MKRHYCCGLIVVSAVLCIALIWGCSSGGGGGTVTAPPSVSGVVAAGAALSGSVYLKDISTPAKELSKQINSDGTYTFDVTGLTKPFLLKAVGSVNGQNYTLYSVTDGPGTANINTMANLVVTCAAGSADFAGMYNSPTAAAVQGIVSNLPASLQEIQSKLQPLLQTYNIESTNPITDAYSIDHKGLDGMLDKVKIEIVDGTVTITNRATNAVVATAPVNDIKSGTITPGNIPVPSAPTGVAATAADGQVVLNWTAAAEAISYNIYWGTAAGINTTGTKIASATNPYTHLGLTNGTTYYYAVTAVNPGGESSVSNEVSAIPKAAVVAPSAPTDVLASAGDERVTIAWSAVDGATAYNIYWASVAGVTKSTGTKISSVTSPYLHTDLSKCTDYYYTVTAVNTAGESSLSPETTARTKTSGQPICTSGPQSCIPGPQICSYNQLCVPGPQICTYNQHCVPGPQICTSNPITHALSCVPGPQICTPTQSCVPGPQICTPTQSCVPGPQICTSGSEICIPGPLQAC